LGGKELQGLRVESSIGKTVSPKINPAPLSVGLGLCCHVDTGGLR